MGSRWTALVVLCCGVGWGLLSLLFQKENYMRELHIPPPKFLYDIALDLYTFSVRIHDKMVPSHHLVIQDMYGVYRTQISYTLAKIGIADILGDAELSINEISNAARVDHPHLLLRLLRAAESIGYFYEDPRSGRWRNTAKSSVLRKDHPNSLYFSLQDFVETDFLSVGSLYESIITGKNTFPKYHDGQSVWEYFHLNPEKEQIFANSMTNFNKIGAYGQARDYNWGQHNRVVDIAGSFGPFLLELLQLYPSLHGHLFDIESVIDRARHYWESDHNMYVKDNRISFSFGSFFNVSSLPKIYDGDVILLKNILHDWSDHEALVILQNLRESIGHHDATLALIELSLDDKDLWPNYFMDLHMHVLVEGKERTKEDWKVLFDHSGYYLEDILKTRSLHKIILAKPKLSS